MAQLWVRRREEGCWWIVAKVDLGWSLHTVGRRFQAVPFQGTVSAQATTLSWEAHYVGPTVPHGGNAVVQEGYCWYSSTGMLRVGARSRRFWLARLCPTRQSLVLSLPTVQHSLLALLRSAALRRVDYLILYTSLFLTFISLDLVTS
jgi:hypothetical protein